MPRVIINGYGSGYPDYAEKSPETRQFEEENELTQQYDPMLLCTGDSEETDLKNGLSKRQSLCMPTGWDD